MAFQVQQLFMQTGAMDYGSDEPDSRGHSDNNWYNQWPPFKTKEEAQRSIDGWIWSSEGWRIREVA